MSQKRQALIDTAIRLFSEYGFHNTGIDRIAEEAGVSKRTLYYHFRSKEELVVAALQHHDSLFRNYFMKSVTRSAQTPYDRLLAIFEVAGAWFAERDFYGCMFINAIGEYADRESGIQQACQAFKAQMVTFVAELAAAAEVPAPDALAAKLSLLLEGAIVTAQVAGDPTSAATARDAARVIIDAELAAARGQAVDQ